MSKTENNATTTPKPKPREYLHRIDRTPEVEIESDTARAIAHIVKQTDALQAAHRAQELRNYEFFLAMWKRTNAHLKGHWIIPIIQKASNSHPRGAPKVTPLFSPETHIFFGRKPPDGPSDLSMVSHRYPDDSALDIQALHGVIIWMYEKNPKLGIDDVLDFLDDKDFKEDIRIDQRETARMLRDVKRDKDLMPNDLALEPEERDVLPKMREKQEERENRWTNVLQSGKLPAPSKNNNVPWNRNQKTL